MPAAPVLAALLLAVFASPAAAAWGPPVNGALTRPFAVTADPFEAGQHRGIDLLLVYAAQIAWLIGLVVIGRVVLARAVRRVVVQGG